MRRWTPILLAMAVLFALILTSCNSGKSQKAEETKAKAIQEESNKKAQEELRAREETERKAKDIEQRKQFAINQIREAFGLEQHEKAKEKPEPEWVNELKGETGKKKLAEAREAYDKFQEMEYALSYFDPDHKDFNISWEEVGIEEKNARGMFKQAGLEAARALFATFDLPWEVRNKEEFAPEREGVWSHFSDGHKVMVEIVDVLVSIGAAPNNIGTNAKDMKQLVLRDLKAEILAIRKEVSEKKAGGSDAYGDFLEMLEKAMKYWKFTPAELGLDKNEIEMLKSLEGEGGKG